MSILSSVALGWFGRRILDVGGWVGGVLWVVLKTYSELPPAGQELVGKVLQGHWQEITLGGAVGFFAWLWSQRASFLATVKTQVVTPQGAKIEGDQLSPAAWSEVVAAASQAKPRRTIANVILDALSRKRG